MRNFTQQLFNKLRNNYLDENLANRFPLALRSAPIHGDMWFLFNQGCFIISSMLCLSAGAVRLCDKRLIWKTFFSLQTSCTFIRRRKNFVILLLTQPFSTCRILNTKNGRRTRSCCGTWAFLQPFRFYSTGSFAGRCCVVAAEEQKEGTASIGEVVLDTTDSCQHNDNGREFVHQEA